MSYPIEMDGKKEESFPLSILRREKEKRERDKGMKSSLLH